MKTQSKIKALKLIFSKRCASKIWGGVSDIRLKKLDSVTLETSKNHLIRNFMRNERVRVEGYVIKYYFVKTSKRHKRSSIAKINFSIIDIFTLQVGALVESLQYFSARSATSASSILSLGWAKSIPFSLQALWALSHVILSLSPKIVKITEFLH